MEYINPIKEVERRLLRKIEERLITRIEEIEGRVPTNEEIARHGQRVIFPDGRKEYAWKGAKIIEVLPPDFSQDSWSWTVNG